MANVLRFLTTFVEDDYSREDFLEDPSSVATRAGDDLTGEDVMEALAVVRIRVEPELAARLDPAGPFGPAPRLGAHDGQDPFDVALDCLRWIDDAIAERSSSFTDTGDGGPLPAPPANRPMPVDPRRDEHTQGDDADAPVEEDHHLHVFDDVAPTPPTEPEDNPQQPTHHDHHLHVFDDVAPEPEDNPQQPTHEDHHLHVFDDVAPEPEDNPQQPTHDDHHLHVFDDVAPTPPTEPEDNPQQPTHHDHHLHVFDDVARTVEDADEPAELRTWEDDAPAPWWDATTGDAPETTDASHERDPASPTDAPPARPSFGSTGGLGLPVIGEGAGLADAEDLAEDEPRPDSGGGGFSLPTLGETDNDLPFAGDEAGPDERPDIDGGDGDGQPFPAEDEPGPGGSPPAPSEEVARFSVLEMVRIDDPPEGSGLEAGAAATIIAVHPQPRLLYEVEVNDETGQRMFLGVVEPDDLSPYTG